MTVYSDAAQGPQDPDIEISRLSAALSEIDPNELSDESRLERFASVLRAIEYAGYSFYGVHQDQDDGFWHRDTWAPSPGSTSAVLVPVERNISLPTINSLLNQSVLYSRRSVIVLPVDLKISHKGRTFRFNVDPSIASLLIRLNHNYRELIDAGLGIFLPRSISSSAQDEISAIYLNATAPLRQNDSLSYLPMNRATNPDILDRQLTVFKTFLLPCFPDCDFDTMAKIAKNETDAFARFTFWITKKVSELQHVTSEDGFNQILLEIDAGVAELQIAAQRLHKMRLLDGARIATFAVSIGGVIQGVNSTMAHVATIAGTATLMDLIRQFSDRHTAKIDLEKSSFYIPYLFRNQ